MLPLILAGPFVRRVDARHASFWVAVRQAATVTAHVWQGVQQSAGIGAVASQAPFVATGSAPAVRFGTNLFVAVVTARGNASFQPGQIHAYDLSFVWDDAATAPTNLDGQGLLDEEDASTRLPNVDPAAPLHEPLGYVTGQLPSFVTPAGSVVDLRLAHASCRDIEDDGADAMTFLNEEVKAHLLDPAGRPQQLFLTGDQIYADHVSRSLLKPLTELAAELIGGAGERVPVAGADVALTLANFPAHRRLRLVREEALVSGMGGHSHALGFGEYAAMYLLAWSSRVWRPLATAEQVYVAATSSAVAAKLTDWEKCRGSLEAWKTVETTLQKGQTHTSFEIDAGRTALYRAAVPKVAQLLANCATYMVFDDHDVCDDWNLNKRWRNRVVTKPLGRALIRNAVMAYTLFQGWGNDPRAFTRPDKSIFDPTEGLPEPQPGDPVWARDKVDPDKLSKNGQLMKLTHDAFAGAGPYPAGDVSGLEALLGLNDPDTAEEADKKATFSYTVDAVKHRVVVLDTRTRRSYRGEGLSPPALLGKTLKTQLPAGPFLGDQELLVVVSAAPVLGPSIVEDVQLPASIAVHDVTTNVAGDEAYDPCRPGVALTGAEKNDDEGWDGDEPAREELLGQLGTYPSVVILSGDVHYAYSAALDYWTAARPGAVSRIVQLTSSGAKQGGSALRPIIKTLPLLEGALRGEPVERLAWKEEAAITLPAGSSIAPGRRARMLRKPALVPAGGWPAQSTVTTPPDWRWRMELLRDERPVPLTERPEPIEELDPADILAGLARVVTRHASVALDRRDQMRVLVFASNTALVTFHAVDSDLRVRHSLFSEALPGSAAGAENTRHETSLRPRVADAGPELRTEAG